MTADLNQTTSAAAAPAPAPTPSSPPDPEVVERAKRRRFTAEYKLRILDQADRCEPGELGALLRREGLYSSHLTTWRRQREAGALAAWRRTSAAPRPSLRASRWRACASLSARTRSCASAWRRPRPSSTSKKSLQLAGAQPEQPAERRKRLMRTSTST